MIELERINNELLEFEGAPATIDTITKEVADRLNLALDARLARDVEDGV